MSAHFAELLEQLHRRCLGMGAMVQATVRMALDAMQSRNAQASQAVFESEQHIDAEEVEIERQAINLLALHQPAASDLRTLFAIVKINGDLERIADCAVNIAQQVPPFVHSGVDAPRDLRVMADSLSKQLDDTMRALANKDTTLAEQVTRSDDLIDALYNQVLQDLQAAMIAQPTGIPGYLALILIARNLERMGDHCTNISEDILYRMRGRIVRHTHDPR